MRCIEIKQKNSQWAHMRQDKLQHEMYWNAVGGYAIKTGAEDKLQHEMYWNDKKGRDITEHAKDKLQHEMYWNLCAMWFSAYHIR